MGRYQYGVLHCITLVFVYQPSCSFVLLSTEKTLLVMLWVGDRAIYRVQGWGELLCGSEQELYSLKTYFFAIRLFIFFFADTRPFRKYWRNLGTERSRWYELSSCAEMSEAKPISPVQIPQYLNTVRDGPTPRFYSAVWESKVTLIVPMPKWYGHDRSLRWTCVQCCSNWALSPPESYLCVAESKWMSGSWLRCFCIITQSSIRSRFCF